MMLQTNKYHRHIPLRETSKAPVDINCPSIMFVVKNMRIQAYICKITKNNLQMQEKGKGIANY